MTRRTTSAFGLLLAAAGALAACSAVSRAPAKLDYAAKQLQPPAGWGLVYIVRPSFFGTVHEMPVFANGHYVGTTGGQRYLYTALRPGWYTFESRAENVSRVRLYIHAGRTYFLHQRLLMGFLRPRVMLRPLHPVAGRRYLYASYLSRAQARWWPLGRAQGAVKHREVAPRAPTPRAAAPGPAPGPPAASGGKTPPASVPPPAPTDGGGGGSPGSAPPSKSSVH